MCNIHLTAASSQITEGAHCKIPAGLGFHSKVLTPFKGVPSSLGSGLHQPLRKREVTLRPFRKGRVRACGIFHFILSSGRWAFASGENAWCSGSCPREVMNEKFVERAQVTRESCRRCFSREAWLSAGFANPSRKRTFVFIRNS
jgi:hypothetical protein